MPSCSNQNRDRWRCCFSNGPKGSGVLGALPDTDRALREMHRVLRRSGHLLFVEHGRAPESNVRWWQDRLTPVWKRIGGGCHLNRAIQMLIENAGFQFDRLETGYIHGPNPLTFMYEGSARPR
jgi:SAM-dependent methyltransferase